MPVRKVAFVPGEFYHIYNRGNSRQEIFLSDQDHQRFVDLLYAANGSSSFDLRTIKPEELYTYERGKQQVAIGAYCLMPNHFHLLVTPLTEEGITSFMRKLTTGYSMYFNKKYFRTGSLFEGRYKSEHACDDEYLKYLFSYIHLNPVKLIQSNWREVGIQDREHALTYLQNFQYSSYIDTQKIRPQTAILDQKFFPVYFSNKVDFETELLEWLSLTKARPS